MLIHIERLTIYYTWELSQENSFYYKISNRSIGFGLLNTTTQNRKLAEKTSTFTMNLHIEQRPIQA